MNSITLVVTCCHWYFQSIPYKQMLHAYNNNGLMYILMLILFKIFKIQSTSEIFLLHFLTITILSFNLHD